MYVGREISGFFCGHTMSGFTVLLFIYALWSAGNVCVCVCVCVRNTICIVGGFIIGFIFTVLLFICVCIWSEGNVCVCCVCVRVHSLCFFHLRTCMQRILQFLCVTGFIIVFHCVSIHYAVWSGFSREQCASSHPLFHSVCHRLHLLGISHEVRHTHTHTHTHNYQVCMCVSPIAQCVVQLSKAGYGGLLCGMVLHIHPFLLLSSKLPSL